MRTTRIRVSLVGRALRHEYPGLGVRGRHCWHHPVLRRGVFCQKQGRAQLEQVKWQMIYHLLLLYLLFGNLLRLLHLLYFLLLLPHRVATATLDESTNIINVVASESTVGTTTVTVAYGTYTKTCEITVRDIPTIVGLPSLANVYLPSLMSSAGLLVPVDTESTGTQTNSFPSLS